jgi:hypothetical protein
MDRQAYGRLPLAAAAAGVFLPCVTFAASASAHVKWFCAFDVAGQPRGLENVLCQDFEALVGIAIAALSAGCLLEGTSIGDALLRALDRVTGPLQANAEILIRAACGFFFVALWTLGGIILTPELTTSVEAISWLQLAIAAGLIWRRTLPLSALGIVALFAIAVHDYGIFHLADYPIFLGIAAYLALTGLEHGPEKWIPGFRKGPCSTASRRFRDPAARYCALRRGLHADVGFDREMGLSGMELSAVRRASGADARLR